MELKADHKLLKPLHIVYLNEEEQESIKRKILTETLTYSVFKSMKITR